MIYFYAYMAFINVFTFIVFAMDKKKAKYNKWRIPEARLLFFSLIGGSLGGLLAMNLLRHKTKTLKFTIGMPLILILNIVVIFYINKIW